MSNPYRDYRGMAYAAGIGFWEDGSLSPAIERFAALVAAAEREECAKACDVLAVHPEYASDITKVAAQAIRARSEK